MKALASVFVTLAFLSLSAVALGSEIYEWVDEDGITQYSQTPPSHAESQKYESKETGTLSVSGSGKKASPAEDKALESQQKEVTAIKNQLKAEQERIKVNCEVAQHNLKILQTVGTAKYQNDQGESAQMTAEEHEAKVIETKAQIEAYCTQS